MTTLTATKARREFFDLVKGAAEGHKTFRIQHRHGAAVLLSEDDYEGLLETLELLSLPRFRQRLKASVQQMKSGDTIPMSELFGTRK
ncbi:MAG: type II toxin-antitoxin system Phd/YefM family antitoxin [Kiritimatiellia bacterium]